MLRRFLSTIFILILISKVIEQDGTGIDPYSFLDLP